MLDQGGDPLRLADRNYHGRHAQPQIIVELDDEEQHQDGFGADASKWLTAESLGDDNVDDEEVDPRDEGPGSPVTHEFSGGESETGGANDEERDRDVARRDREPLRDGVRGAGPVGQHADENADAREVTRDAVTHQSVERLNEGQVVRDARSGRGVAVGARQL